MNTLKGKVSKGAISKWFRENFGGHRAYSVECQRETLLPKLQSLTGDFAGFMDPDDFLDAVDKRAVDPAHD